MAGTAVKTAAEANQHALETATNLQLKTLQEINTRSAEVLKQLEDTHETFQADKELIESFIAGMDSLVERMNVQIETMIKLHNEMRAYYEAIVRERR